MFVQIELVQKPWGQEIIWAYTPDYIGKVLVIKPNMKLSRQYHADKDETFFVRSGTMTLEIGYVGQDLKSVEMKAGMSFHCPPGEIHRMCAGPDGCEVLEASTSHRYDVVRIEDDFDRI